MGGGGYAQYVNVKYDMLMPVPKNCSIVEAGQVKPTIYKTLPITEAQQAHEILYKGQNVGKVVLTVE